MTGEKQLESAVWTEAEWRALEKSVRDLALKMREADMHEFVVRACRRVMRSYTTSFFIVSRFLPRAKRDDVESIYAAVRYPDEVVDSFPLSADERDARLAGWEHAYETALKTGGLRESLERNVPVFLAPFVEVVKRRGIPPDYYRSFLQAMRLDMRPRLFETLTDLIDSYIYGSAIVVGYFLTYAYGASEPGRFDEAMESARDLGIALQLTNFLRDVAEDQRRGRVYLPRDLLRAEGIEKPDALDPNQHEALGRVVRKMADAAASHYAKSEARLDAFAPDCRVAIRACIAVYGQLNERIRRSERGITFRESVPFRDKWRVLPVSKYWRIPWAYLAS